MWPVNCVIVKAGTQAYVFYYPDGANSDTELYAPNGKEISHVTFCFNPIDDEEWKGETAWAGGARYVTKGNWATYTPYSVNSPVTLYAGQSYRAGSVSFSAPADGKVTITITLNQGFRFEDVKENIKIEGYTIAPSGNPSPGLFTFKDKAAASPFEIVVDQSNFYGIHVNVERLVN